MSITFPFAYLSLSPETRQPGRSVTSALPRIGRMSQQPFSRPGAIDLSGLKRPTQAQPSGGGTPAGGDNGSSYSVTVTEQNFQQTVEASMTAPVVLVFHSSS